MMTGIIGFHAGRTQTWTGMSIALATPNDSTSADGVGSVLDDHSTRAMATGVIVYYDSDLETLPPEHWQMSWLPPLGHVPLLQRQLCIRIISWGFESD